MYMMVTSVNSCIIPSSQWCIISFIFVLFCIIVALLKKGVQRLQENREEHPNIAKTEQVRASRQSQKKSRKEIKSTPKLKHEQQTLQVYSKSDSHLKKGKRHRKRKKHLLFKEDHNFILVRGRSYNEDEHGLEWTQVTSKKHKLKTSSKSPDDLKDLKKLPQTAKENVLKKVIRGSANGSVTNLLENESKIEKVTTPTVLEPQTIMDSRGNSTKHCEEKPGSKQTQTMKPDLLTLNTIVGVESGRLSRTSSGYISDTELSARQENSSPLLQLKKRQHKPKRPSRILEGRVANIDHHEVQDQPIERVIPVGAVTHREKVDASGANIDFHNCKVKIGRGALPVPTTISIDRWNRPEVLCDDGLIITPTIQCEPSGLVFKEPVQFSLPVSYMPKEQEIEVQVEVSFDNVTWEKLCVRRLSPGSKRVIEFQSDHFSRYRARACNSDVSQLLKYVTSVGYVKRNWWCLNPDRYDLVWCICDDDPELNDRVFKEMQNDENYCYDRIIDPETFCVESGNELILKLNCGQLSITPTRERIAIKADDWHHQVSRKCKFILRKRTLEEEHKHYTLNCLITVKSAEGNRKTKLDEFATLEWSKDVQLKKTSSVGVMVNEMNMNVASEAAGFNIAQTQTSVSSGEPHFRVNQPSGETTPLTVSSASPSNESQVQSQFFAARTPSQIDHIVPNGLCDTPPRKSPKRNKTTKKKKKAERQGKQQDDMTSSSSSSLPLASGRRGVKSIIPKIFRRSKGTRESDQQIPQ